MSFQLDRIPLSQDCGHLKSQHSYTPITIKKGPNGIHVCDANNNKYDVADETYAKILQVLLNDSNIGLQAFLERSPSEDQKGMNSKQKCAQTRKGTIHLSVILYGSPVLFDRVGEFLNNCLVYMQRPYHCDRNVPYRNPQSLSGQDADAPLTMDLENHVSSFEIETLTEQADLAAAMEVDDAFPETKAPSCVRTSLHR